MGTCCSSQNGQSGSQKQRRIVKRGTLPASAGGNDPLHLDWGAIDAPQLTDPEDTPRVSQANFSGLMSRPDTPSTEHSSSRDATADQQSLIQAQDDLGHSSAELSNTSPCMLSHNSETAERMMMTSEDMPSPKLRDDHSSIFEHSMASNSNSTNGYTRSEVSQDQPSGGDTVLTAVMNPLLPSSTSRTRPSFQQHQGSRRLSALARRQSANKRQQQEGFPSPPEVNLFRADSPLLHGGSSSSTETTDSARSVKGLIAVAE